MDLRSYFTDDKEKDIELVIEYLKLKHNKLHGYKKKFIEIMPIIRENFEY